MPARSRSQQRLFGMVHAYNKGEFRGNPELRKRLKEMSSRISDEDARHFANTKHEDLPEKKAQAYFRPEDMQAMYERFSAPAYDAISERARRRRTLLGSIIGGTAAGAALGGLGAGGFGAFLAYRAAKGGKPVPPDVLKSKLIEAGLRCGAWGATRGAGLGAAGGAGLYVLGKVRGEQ